MALLGRLVAAVRGTEYIPGDVQDFLDECADMGANRLAAYSLYQEYYDGERGAKLRDRAREYLERQSGVPFCENFAEPVVDALAERLEVIGFSSSEANEDTGDDPTGSVVEEWWQRCRMDAMQGVVHTKTLICGDDFLIVEWHEEEEMPRFCLQKPHQIKVCYSDDDPGMIEYAVKVWNSRMKGPQNAAGKPVQRMNLYFPDRVEKWYRLTNGDGQGNGGWEHWSDEGDMAWPVPWVSNDGEPLGIPVVHFRSKPLGDGPGRSRVKPVIPFQEQLNKYAADLNDLIDNHALPQDWATGVSGDMELKRVPGNVWKGTTDTVKFGRLDASPTTNLLEAIEGVLSRLARRSRVPMHLLTGGTPPSGESLKTSESGLVATAKAAQIAFGNSWEDAMMLGLRLATAFGDLELPDDLTLQTNWANPETRSDEADLNVATLKKSLGVSRYTLLTELGYDAEKEALLRQGEAEMAAEAAGAMLDSGAGFGGGV